MCTLFPAAVAWGEEVGGVAQGAFKNDVLTLKGASHEFDVITNKFVGQHKFIQGSGSAISSSTRSQMKATFEAAKVNGLNVIYRFEGNVEGTLFQSYENYQKKYSEKYGVGYEIQIIK